MNINAEKSVVVSAVNVEDELVADKFRNANALKLEDAEDWIFWDKNYKNMELTDLKEDMVITYIRSADGEYVRGMVSESKFNGEITKTSLTGVRKTIDINDINYKLSGSLSKSGIKFSAGDKVVVYLNYKDEIVAIDKYENKHEFGYVIAARINDEFGNEGLQVKMLLENGTVKILDCAKSLKLDGAACKTQAEINSAYTTLSTPQVVRYILGSDNKIRELDTSELAETAGEGTTGNSLLHLMPPETGKLTRKMQYFITPKLFVGDGYGVETSAEKYGQMIIDSGTKVMVVPAPGVTDAKDDDYYVTSDSYFVKNGDHDIQGYVSSNDELYPELLLVELGAGATVFGNNVVFVTGEYTTMNKNGEAVDAIETMNTKGEKAEYNFAEGVTSTADVGDVINLALDIRGDIKEIDLIYDASAGNLVGSHATIATYHLTGVRPEIGYVYSVEGKKIAYSQTIPNSGTKYKDLLFLPMLSSTKVYVFENTGREVKCELGGVEDIQDYKGYGVASKIFFYTSEAQVKMIVVYK